jgi:AcrR family transcriptional regulator
MARHKPAAEGGYQRGEDTRERIIEAALGIFGERGYSGASTRDIAAAAGVNAPALQYYFDNKEGLYIACVEYIIERIWEKVATEVQGAEVLASLADTPDNELIDAYLLILGCFFSFVHDSPRSTSWRLFMAREMAGMGPPGSYERIDRSVQSRIADVSCAIVGRLTGVPATDERTIIRSFAINSQAMTFRVLRRKVLEALSWDSIDLQRMELIRGLLLSQTRIMLNGLVVERGTMVPNASEPADS